ncbi:MAG TPA: AMP-binding protein [Solirubrobacter sp.]|nr:AMP-binding protein [Solirubrobacter sp.]
MRPFARRTLVALLEDRRPADAPFLEIAGERCSWADLRERATDFSRRLASLGVGRGDVVCQLAGNTLDHVVTTFAVARLGAIECPVNTGLQGPSLRHVLNHSGAKVILVEAPFAEQVEAVRDGLDAVIVARGEKLPAVDAPTADVRPGDPATIMYTSGTTGPAKGVVLPHHFAFATAAVKASAWGLTADDVLFTPLPLFHSNARYSTLLTAAIVGARAVVVERFSASRFWDQVRDSGATEIGTVGTVPAILLERPPSPRDRDHRVRMMHGAGALAPARRREFEERFGIALVTGFAMTETSHFATGSPDDPLRAAGSGRPVPGFQVAILDDDDHVLPAGETGEIAVRPNVPFSMFLGYHRQPEATLEAMRNQWFHTGDLGRIDAEGILHWSDRKKDAIRRRGEMISSQDVEAAVQGFPGVAAVAAVGIPGELGEEEVALFLRAEPGLDLDALAAHCAATLPRFAVPSRYEIVDEFPLTETMKVDKKRLRAELSAPRR